MKMIYFIFYLQSIRDYFILKKKILVTYLVHYGMKIFIVFQETSQCLCEKKRGDVLGSLVLTTPYIFSVFSLYAFSYCFAEGTVLPMLSRASKEFDNWKPRSFSIFFIIVNYLGKF